MATQLQPARVEQRERLSAPEWMQSFDTRRAEARRVPVAIWLHWILRVGVLAEFVGHGAFGIMGKEAWLPYFHLFGIPDRWAWIIMPIVGTIDVSVGILTLVRPMRLVLLYATFWATMTALLRPLAGQGLWEEVFERAGNVGLPLALLALVGPGNRSPRSWFEHARPRPLTHDGAVALSRLLRVLVALLLIGHGGFGVSHLHDQEWTGYLGVLGLGAGSVSAWHLIVVVGWFEVALGIAVLVTPSRGLVLTVLAWKVATELLRPLAGESVWEFIERGGDYFLPLALFLVYGWLAAPGPHHERSNALAPSAPAAASRTDHK